MVTKFESKPKKKWLAEDTHYWECMTAGEQTNKPVGKGAVLSRSRLYVKYSRIFLAAKVNMLKDYPVGHVIEMPDKSVWKRVK